VYEVTNDNQHNGFTKHGIQHLSPSSINMAAGSMSAWCVRYLMNERFPSGGAAERGKATEVGVSHGLFTGADDEECVSVALDAFDTAMRSEFFFGLEGRDKFRQEVIAMTPLALEALRPFGKPTPAQDGSVQHEIGLSCRFREGEAGTVHIKGFLDFYYEDAPLVIDLKTTGRAPSEFSQAHAIQASVYAMAMKCPVKFLYVTPKKIVWHEITGEQMDACLGLVKSQAARLERYLSLSDDPEQLTRSAPHDPSTFYWRGAEHLLPLLE
jgi:hypothetical protein